MTGPQEAGDTAGARAPVEEAIVIPRRWARYGAQCFVMPARIAATDPFRQIGEYVGSEPIRFVRNEWVPGAKAVFEKFADYVPGAGVMAGGR